MNMSQEQNKKLLNIKENTKDNGFTLIEIITVIGIMTLIMGTIYPFLTTINRYGGITQNNMQNFEDGVNNFFLAISRDIRNANLIDIYNNGIVGEQGNKITINIDSSSVTYQLNSNSIEQIKSSTKKIIPNVKNISIDNSSLIFQDPNYNNPQKMGKIININLTINYPMGINEFGSKSYSNTVVKRN